MPVRTGKISHRWQETLQVRLVHITTIRLPAVAMEIYICTHDNGTQSDYGYMYGYVYRLVMSPASSVFKNPVRLYPISQETELGDH